MDRPDLLVEIEGLQLVDVGLALAVWVAVEGVQRNFLPPGQFLFRDGLTRGGVKHIAPLAGQTFEVVGNIYCRQIGRRKSGIRLGLLLFPTWIKQLN